MPAGPQREVHDRGKGSVPRGGAGALGSARGSEDSVLLFAAQLRRVHTTARGRLDQLSANIPSSFPRVMARYFYLAAAATLAVALSPLLAAGDVLTSYCGSPSNRYAPNSTFAINLQSLAETLPRNASSSRTLFATAAIGVTPDTVYALLHCRGDLSAASCQSCATGAFQDAQQLCAYNKDSTVFYAHCTLRYSNQNFIISSSDFGDSDDRGPRWRSSENASAPATVLDAAVSVLLTRTAEHAATSSMRFATGMQQNPKIFALVQCTPDLAPSECRSCLAYVVAAVEAQMICSGAQRCTVNSLRCGYFYSQSAFFSGTPMVQLPSSASTGDSGRKGGKSDKHIVLEIALPSGAAVVLAIGIYGFLHYRRKRKKMAISTQGQQPAGGEIKMTDLFDDEDKKLLESLLIDFQTLRAATNDFGLDNQLGQGGFGTVYKGELPDKQLVAVKRLSNTSGQGLTELRNEVISLVKVQHKSLVKIVGFCLEEHEKLIVYEYLPNKSLDNLVYDAEKRKLLDMLAIIDGIGRGLQYLHEDSNARIVHRDLKATNVLLDKDYKPKISDFGLARILSGDQSHQTASHRVGTFGYIAMEYGMTGRYSEKTDVYSFGVLLLEIITGKPNGGGAYLLTLVWSHWTQGTILDIVDSSYPADRMERCIHIGLLCVQDEPANRPTMSEVNIMLNSSAPLRAPAKPLLAEDLGPDEPAEDLGPDESASAGGLLSPITELSGRSN